MLFPIPVPFISDMSNEVAIRVQGLGKMFRIGGKPARYKTFRDTVTGLFKRTSGPRKAKSEPFWALKDLSFEIKRGEVVGIIGRNGAGKSTLLKILSRITDPTEGYGEIQGRVGSLLEVGTGFHPELTGRENVFLNGAILGMRRAEIEKKFDDIVEFAEVEKFIDTPVKHYSTGMYLRLAFAVAAHLETEILLVDEVLAVGDVQFQRKCLGKMGEVAQHGRTVLFVSHNLATVVDLCQRVILLEAGRIKHDGSASESVNLYAKAIVNSSQSQASVTGQFGFEEVKVNESLSPTIDSFDPLKVFVRLRGVGEDNPLLYLFMEDASGKCIVCDRKSLNKIDGAAVSGDRNLYVSIPSLSLAPGFYSVYFKALSTIVGQPSRVLSERIPLVVRGETDLVGYALLCPSVRWSVEDRQAPAEGHSKTHDESRS
jgi:lipopolysaccharide transport system ATP-binding protein